MIQEPLLYWLALKQVQGVGNILAKRLIETFGTPHAVFSASEEALWALDGVSENVARNIVTFNAFDNVQREMEKVDKAGVTLLTLTDPAYPVLLSKIDDPPLVLYAKGAKIGPDLYPITIVGTRNITMYGKSVTEMIVEGLTRVGMTIVSGFARGVDAVAHQAALAHQGKTIAVLGHGIDRVYPPDHARLYHQILEGGVLLSEFCMGEPPLPHHFPQRNRILSGYSQGCVVIEASQKSGALITARLALEQGREVFAVPGSIFSETSQGTHHLLQSGAKLVCQAQDILDELVPQMGQAESAPKPQTVELAGEEATLYNLLSMEPKHIDWLIEESAMEPSHVSRGLLELELKGVVRQHAGQRYTQG